MSYPNKDKQDYVIYCSGGTTLTKSEEVHKFKEHRGDFIVPQANHTFKSYFHIILYYRLILCCVHPLTDKFGIVLHKPDDAVVVLGIGIAYPSALYHFQRFQTDFYRFNPFAVNGGG